MLENESDAARLCVCKLENCVSGDICVNEHFLKMERIVDQALTVGVLIKF